MKLKIDKAMLDEITDTGRADTNQETCAVLFGHKVNRTVIVDGYLFVPNRHRDPDLFFQINKSDVPSHQLSKIIGCFHTHLYEGHNEPSAIDIAELPKDMLGLVLHVPTGTVHAYGKSQVKLTH